MNHIIGGGGTGSWLCPALCLLVKPANVTVWDGDRLEVRNLNRQLFTDLDLGQNKAVALARKYGCGHLPQYFSHTIREFSRRDWLLVCADNHPARHEAIVAADQYGCRCIIAGNETHSAEAFVYDPAWQHSPRDPRQYYPEIVTETGGDPLAVRAGCTGQAQAQNPQLVSANLMAASLALHLYVLWALEGPNIAETVRQQMPCHFSASLGRVEIIEHS